MRRRKGLPIHGWINIDKPVGPTSTQVIGRVRRLTGAAKVGHAGTLDPLASGVLPIALGEATKTVPYIQDARKIYRFTVRWGEATTTDDREGAVIAHSDNRPGPEAIAGVLPRFTGTISQAPPAFSAIRVAGERAYDLARAGGPVALAERDIDVHRLELTGQEDGDHSIFEVETGKGAYVRSLARDMGAALGCFGHVSALRRLAVGQFRAENGYPLDFDALPSDIAGLTAHVLPIETVLDDIPALALTADEAQRLRCGQTVGLFTHHHRDWLAELIAEGRDHGIILALWQGKAVAMVRIDSAEAQPVRVFNYEP
ncbi:MAG TPA: tRNA pseudouridine(55) synthase TruB [Alphaproteobacteria bacterium]|jgi:tRNA pseudouridine55 synthase|nr:tRNA pseudouridine(55) synthase TruB [Alphaproteobacteria bacterium]